MDPSLLSISVGVAGKEIGSPSGVSGVADLRSSLSVVHSSFLGVGFGNFPPPGCWLLSWPLFFFLGSFGAWPLECIFRSKMLSLPLFL